MKKNSHLKAILLAGAGLAFALSSALAQPVPTLTTSWTNTFDTPGRATNSWCWWYDMEQDAYGFGYNALITNSWSSAMNSTNGPAPTSGTNSGSLEWYTWWPGVAEGTTKGGQTLIYGTFGGANQYDLSQTIDATKYTSLSFDLYVDPHSPLDSAGNVCSLTVGFFLNNYGFYNITNLTIATNNFGKWMRYTALINPASAPSPATTNLPAGPGFNINCYGGENASLFTNTLPTILYIDNLYLKLSTAPTPPPTMQPPTPSEDIIPGLNIFAENVVADQYQRNEIELLQTTGVTFLGAAGVTSYSFTITNFPPVADNGFQAHIFVATGPGTSPALDYNDSNVVWLNVQENGDGSGNGYFRYKVNEPNANSNMFGAEYISTTGGASAGTLAALHASTVLGTWGMSFNNSSNVTVFGPGGVTTNFTMRAAAVTNFVEPLYICFGAQPNTASNTYNGQDVVLANAAVTNAGTAVVFDNFLADTTLNTGVWTTLENEPNTVQLFPNDPAQVLVSWNLPDAGFGLEFTTNLNSPISWKALTGPEASVSPAPSVLILTPGVRTVLVPGADLSNTNQAFFRLNNQSFVQLQVLMPGENNAPGTPTGKSGKPTAESLANGGLLVTVNACDANWYVVQGVTDMVQFTSSDSKATLPPNTALVGGSVQVFFQFGQTGTYTVTATDVTNPSITPNTGGATVVTP
jgi:hypothetical protein